MKFRIDPAIQTFLETICARILRAPEALCGALDIKTKKPGDVLIEADVFCDRVLADACRNEGFQYHSEETPGDLSIYERDEILVMADPIDGSTNFGRYGAHHTPVTTAAMAMRGGTVVAAVVGDLWTGSIYGIDGSALYAYHHHTGPKERKPIVLAREKRSIRLRDAHIAVYAPNFNLMQLIYPNLYEQAVYVGTSAGIGTQLALVEQQAAHSLSASIESKPTDLFESIGALMATFAGAYACRMDGRDIQLDPRLLQTCLLATSRDLAEEIVDCVRENYARCAMPHAVRLGTPEAEPFKKG